MQKDKGILKAWKDDKGFGFIKPDTGGADVFVHIRDFGAIARKPRVGDVIFYQSVRDGSGKYRAADVEIEGLPRFTKPASPGNKPKYRKEEKVSPRYGLIAILIAIASLAVVSYNKYAHRGFQETSFVPAMKSEAGTAAPSDVPPSVSSPNPAVVPGEKKIPVSAIEKPTPIPYIDSNKSSAYKCEGKTHCSQMTSCAEATYYINHCPNTEMDGNNDGVPCESQWCK